jgi:hypothetical protein
MRSFDRFASASPLPILVLQKNGGWSRRLLRGPKRPVFGTLPSESGHSALIAAGSSARFEQHKSTFAWNESCSVSVS